MAVFDHLTLDDTIVALATPPGAGAIGVIRLSGKKAIDICSEVFHGKDLKEKESHSLVFGTIRENGAIIDEVVVSLFRNPKSYTGEDVVEVSCHGSSFILQKVIELFIKKGARLAKPGEFTLRAFLNGKMDLSQAEAVADLIAANSASAHHAALQQMRGGYSGEIKILREQLINFASLVELELDFAEEDVEFADRAQLIDLIQKIKIVLSQLITSFQLGNAIKNGVATVIAGRPNAGKSTLLNALLNEERAIVSDIPGTTRDTIEEMININGIIFRLIDTAGIRDAHDKIEAMGVQKTMEKIRQSTIVVYVFDVTELSQKELQVDIERLESPVDVIVIGNKTDKGDHTLSEEFIAEHEVTFISSLNKENLEEVKNRLLRAICKDNLYLESTVVTNARHFQALQQADEALENVLEGIDSQISGELLVLDIKRALDALGEITGTITNEDLLGNIFSKFCIGK